MKILHPTDFSEAADQAQEQALRLAHALGGEVILLHVAVETPLYGEGLMSRKEVREVFAAARKWATTTLEERTAALREHGLTARFILKTGVPHEEIVKTAAEEHADLVVMGTHGRGAVERFFLGSVADRVVRSAPCPVLTVRGPKE
jgi:nucleotide-binding universal stress UspA family protein